MNKNIQSISDSYLCSNCGACSAVCPKEAIDFKWTTVGRLYADVNDNCIDCGLCKKVCPSLDYHNLHASFEDKFVGNISGVYVGKTCDNRLFQNAQSGGVATSILSFLFDSGKIDAAIVCQMSYGRIPQVQPVIVTSKEKLYTTQKSCYTPVPLLSILNATNPYKSVAIVGLPCHLNGLAELQKLNTKFSNIRYKIGLICDRTECAGIQEVIKDNTGFDEFIIHWRQKYNATDDSYNYKSAPIVAISKDNEVKVLPRHYRLGLKEMFTPPRCRVCWDKTNVFSDIALGDPWRLKGIDVEKGESLIISRNETGLSLLSEMMSQGCLDLRKVANEAPVKSQLIPERIASVKRFSSAFLALHPRVDSYLISPAETRNAAEKKILLDFSKLESCSKEELLKIAYTQMDTYKKNSQKNKMLVAKIINKIKKILSAL